MLKLIKNENFTELKKKETTYFEIIGITEHDEIIMLDKTFEGTMYGKPFCGAVGTSFAPVTQEYIDERNDLDFLMEEYSYLWEESGSDQTLEEYMQDIIDGYQYEDGYFLGHDTSYIERIPEDFKEKHFPDAETFECIGGGRMFRAKDDTKWKVLLRPDLLKEIQRVESLNERKQPKLELINGGKLF